MINFSRASQFFDVVYNERLYPRILPKYAIRLRSSRRIFSRSILDGVLFILSIPALASISWSHVSQSEAAQSFDGQSMASEFMQFSSVRSAILLSTTFRVPGFAAESQR